LIAPSVDPSRQIPTDRQTLPVAAERGLLFSRSFNHCYRSSSLGLTRSSEGIAMEVSVESTDLAPVNVPPAASAVPPATTDSAWDWRQWLQQDMLGEHALKVIGAIFVISVGWILAGWISRMTYRSLKLAKLDETLSRFLTKFAWWGVLVLSIVICLGIFKVETTSIAAAIGAVGFAIGLAFQGALSNFASGIMLLVFRPYRVGDLIVVNGQMGKVDEIDLFSTTLDTMDNRRIVIPNASIFGNTIENISYHPARRIEVPVGVSYSADIDQTYEVLMRAVCAVPGVLSEPAPDVVLVELANSSVNWSVRAWAKSSEFLLVKQRTIRAAKNALNQAGIEIPFPQMDIHVHGVSSPANSTSSDTALRRAA
jgi:small conductance mechanosensitive channel